jgi:hypothetical protein
VARVLVVGVMRSGKTTLAAELGRLEGVEVVEEPDNPLSRPYGFRVGRQLAQRYFPALRPGDSAPDYEFLWLTAFGLGRRGTSPFSAWERARRRAARDLLGGASPDELLRSVSAHDAPMPARLRVADALAVPERPTRAAPHVVVTANAPLSVEWVAERLAATTVVVLRNPVAILRSWAQLDWLGREGHDMVDELAPEIGERAAERLGVPMPPLGTPPLVRAAWLLGVLTTHLREAAGRNPVWQVVWYEQLVEQPVEALRALARRLGLPWRDDPDSELRKRDFEAREPEAAGVEIDAAELARATALLDAFEGRRTSRPEHAVADAPPDAADEATEQDDLLR